MPESHSCAFFSQLHEPCIECQPLLSVSQLLSTFATTFTGFKHPALSIEDASKFWSRARFVTSGLSVQLKSRYDIVPSQWRMHVWMVYLAANASLVIGLAIWVCSFHNFVISTVTSVSMLKSFHKELIGCGSYPDLVFGGWYAQFCYLFPPRHSSSACPCFFLPCGSSLEIAFRRLGEVLVCVFVPP